MGNLEQKGDKLRSERDNIEAVKGELRYHYGLQTQELAQVHSQVVHVVQQWKLEEEARLELSYNHELEKLDNVLRNINVNTQDIEEVRKRLENMGNLSELEFLQQWDSEGVEMEIQRIKVHKWDLPKQEELNRLEILKRLCKGLNVIFEDQDQDRSEKVCKKLTKTRENPLRSNSGSKMSYRGKHFGYKVDHKRSFLCTNQKLAAKSIENDLVKFSSPVKNYTNTLRTKKSRHKTIINEQDFNAYGVNQPSSSKREQ